MTTANLRGMTEEELCQLRAEIDRLQTEAGDDQEEWSRLEAEYHSVQAELDSRKPVIRDSDNYVPPIDMSPSPWRTRPGTPERADEEDEAIHGVN